MYRRVFRRQPIGKVPFTWDKTGYTSESFNQWAADPTFSGWPEKPPTEREVRVIAELLGLKAGHAVLDVACGYGRHALLLAQRYGYTMTGLDISHGLVASARRQAARAGTAVEYIVGDARQLAWRGSFDGAYIAYNSFSLFSSEDAPLVLDGIRRALKPGGRLFMDLDNKPGIWRNGTSYTNWGISWDGFKLQEVCFHPESSVEVCRDLYVHPFRRVVDEFVIFKRLYSIGEIQRLLADHGFRIERDFGDWELRPLGEHSRRIILAATKQA